MKTRSVCNFLRKFPIKRKIWLFALIWFLFDSLSGPAHTSLKSMGNRAWSRLEQTYILGSFDMKVGLKMRLFIVDV